MTNFNLQSLTPTMRTLLLLAIASLFSGCASDHYKARKLPAVPVMAQAPQLPRVQTYPVTGEVAQASQRVVMGEPTSVWRPTVIAHVKTDAYVDENNVAWKPSEGYVVLQEGGWNMDAVRSGNNYVPPQNALKPMNMPGVAYGSATVAAAKQADALPLFDVNSTDVYYTNLLRPEDEAQARAMAGEGKVAILDPRLGWLIVPQAVAKGVISTSIQLPSEVRAPAQVSMPLPQAQAEGKAAKKSSDL